MFEVGFQELVMIALLALIVLGPEKLPKLAAQLGRWTGKARMMARNLRQQLETEVSYDDLMKQKEAAEAALRKAQEAPMNFHQEVTADLTATSTPTPATPTHPPALDAVNSPTDATAATDTNVAAESIEHHTIHGGTTPHTPPTTPVGNTVSVS